MYVYTGCNEQVLLSVRLVFFFQAEDGIRDLVRSRGLGDVYKRQATHISATLALGSDDRCLNIMPLFHIHGLIAAVLSLSLIHI